MEHSSESGRGGSGGAAETDRRRSGAPRGWFDTLDAGDRQALLDASEPVRVAGGAFLMRRGDPPDGFYGVVEGRIRICSVRADGRESTLVLIERGQWFGELALVDGRPRLYDAVAAQDAALRRVGNEAFAALMGRASFATAIARLLAMHTRGAYAFVEDAKWRSTRARIARRLERLARGDAELDAAKQRRVLPVTHDLLAAMLGISRQTLSLELKALAAAGAIELGYRSVAIVSMEILRAIGRDPR